MKKLLYVSAVIIGFFSTVAFTPWERDNIVIQSAATVRFILTPIDDGRASSVVLAKDTVITAAHVVAAGMDGATVDGLAVAEILYVDFDTDLAVLRVPGIKCPCATLAKEAPFFLEDIFQVGFPQGWGIKVVTDGRMQGTFPDGQYLTTGAAANGVSGGGMFNENGKLAGIVLALSSSPVASPFGTLWSSVNTMTITAGVDQIKDILVCAGDPGLCGATP